jgi:outer membrane protein, heavy metal efflux system
VEKTRKNRIAGLDHAARRRPIGTRRDTPTRDKSALTSEPSTVWRSLMSTWARKLGLAAAVALGVAGTVGVARAETAGSAEPTASGRVVGSLSDATLRGFVDQVLERNPRIAAAEARARVARLQAQQTKARPDPMLGATAYVSSPETRVGPQTFMGTLSQRFPWFGKLSLKETAALQHADALDAQVEAQRLDLVTETRRLYYEIAFLDARAKVVLTDRDTLDHYEELARTRYASGVGIEQAVIKLQAEITRDDTRLLDIGSRRAALVAALNALRDEPQSAPVVPLALPEYGEVRLDRQALRDRALTLRPEMAQAESEIARADTRIELARKDYRPDITLGATYARVGPRSDAAGIALPPPDNGKDVFAISASINLPIQRGRLKAGVEEAAELRRAADEGKRGVVTAIDQSLGELSERVTLTWQQLHLLRDVLGIQADQSLRSAEAGYAAGTLNSLDLLDAERVLLEVRTSIERTRADYAIALARLEGAVGEPVRPAEGASR